MVQIKEPQPHIQLTDAVDTDCAVVVGDPARVDVMAKFLDEPTNHLDIESIQWLEKVLKRYSGAVLLVSHDRYFLDRIVTKIIDLEGGRARMYRGSYTEYAEKKRRIREAERKAYLKQQLELRLVEEDLLQPFLRLLPPGEDVVFPVILRHIRVLLRKVADLLSLCEGDHPAVRLLLPQDAAKKRRLSGSIDADDRGLLLLLQMEGNVPEHRLVQEGFI